MKVKGFGLLDVDDDHYEKLLRKYHLTDDNLGCIVLERTEIAVKAYTEAINAELMRRHGKDFWKRFQKELAQAKAEPNKTLQPIAPKNGASVER